MNVDADECLTNIKEGRLIKGLDKLTSPAEDRVWQHEYDNAGKIKTTKKSKIFYHADSQFGYAQPESQYTYNQFGDCVSEKKLIRPGILAEKYYWHDKEGNIICQVNENKFVTYYERNSKGKEVKRIEYANALKGEVSSDLTFEKLIESVVANCEKDRIFIYKHDQRGDKIAERLLDATSQKVRLNESNIPVMEDEKHEYLEKQFKYSNTQKLAEVVYEDGKNEKKYYDERDNLIAETGVARTSKDDSGNNIQIIPLTGYLPNAFGRVVVTQTSDKTANFIENELPVHSEPQRVIENIKLVDNRGLNTINQDGNKNQIAFTYNKNRSVASQSQDTTLWKKDASGFSKYQRTDSTIIKNDEFARPTHVRIMAGDKVEQDTYAHYNTFGDLVGEGSEPDKIEAYQKFDASGLSWFSNTENGAYTMHLHDLLGHETLRIQSDTEDLSKYELNYLSTLLSMDRAHVLLEETQRDALGQLCVKRTPIWYRDAQTNPQPSRTLEHDRWGNVVQEWDSRGSLTEREFDKRNLQTKEIKPLINVVNDDQTYSDICPTTKFGYNRRGFEVGVTDAKNHTQAFLLDEASNLIEHVLADGTKEERRELDALARPVKLYDARNKCTKYIYDNMSNALSMELPSGNTYHYEYNETNERTLLRDPGGLQYRFNYDVRKNCIERFTPAGICTNTTYDRNRQSLAMNAPDQATLFWGRDYFGNIYTHSDLNRKLYHYEHGFKAQLNRFWTEGGSMRSHAHISTGIVNGLESSYKLHFIADAAPQDTRYNYGFGLLNDAYDIGIDRHTYYHHDSEQFRDQMEIYEIQTNKLLRRITTHPDKLGRESATIDEHMVVNNVLAVGEVNCTYDAVDNVRHRELLVKAPRYSDQCPEKWLTPQNHWNTFNAADKTLIMSGQLNESNNVVLVRNQGVLFEYEGGLRNHELRLEDSGRGLNTNLKYNDDSYLQSSNCPETNITATWDYHPSGWLKFTITDVNGQDHPSRTMQVDDNGWINYEKDSDKHNTITTNYINGSYGLPVSGEVYDEAAKRRENLSFSYNMGIDTLQLSAIYRQIVNGSGARAEIWYDNNGNVRFKMDSDDEPLVSNKIIAYFDTTHDGLVLSKQYWHWSLRGEEHSKAIPLRFYNFIYNTLGKPHGAYLSQFNWLDTQNDAYVHEHNSTSGHSYPKCSDLRVYNDTHFVGNYYPRDRSEKCDPLWGNFVNYEPPTAIQQYIVEPGDTLEKISEKLFGDSFYAQHLARHNALLLNGMTLAPGYLLRVPQIIPSRNKAQTARPYSEFISLLKGHLTPHLEPLRPKVQHRSHHHGMLGSIVKIVALGIVIAVAPQLAPIILQAAVAGGLISAGAATGAALTTIATGVTAALGDAAVQGLAIKMGAQSQFSVNEMLEVGVSAGALGGLKTGPGLVSAAKEAIYVGTVQVSTQLAEMAAGTRTHFNAQDVALQVAAALTGTQIQQHVSGSVSDPHVAGAVANTTSTVTNSILGHAVTHAPIDVQQMAAQALGNTIGQETGSQLAQKVKIKGDAMAASNAQPAKSSANPFTGSRAEARGSYTTHAPRPMTAHEKQAMAEAEEVAGMKIEDPKLRLPRMRTDDATYKLSEMNREVLRNNNANLMATGVAQVGFFSGLKTELKDAYTSPYEWSMATTEKISEVSKSMQYDYALQAEKANSLAKNALAKPTVDTIAAESHDLAFKEGRFQSNNARLYSNGAKALSKLSLLASKSVVAVDVASKTIDVVNAPAGQKLKTAFEKSMQFGGEVVGAFAGSAAIAYTVPGTFGTSLFVAPPVIIGTSTAGGYLAKQAAKGIENKYDELIQKWRMS